MRHDARHASAPQAATRDQARREGAGKESRAGWVSFASRSAGDDDEPEEGLGDRLHREMLWFDGFLRRWLLRFMVFGTHLTIALVACYCIVWIVARGRSYDTVESTPLRLCGLVLGTLPKVDGRDNVFFTSRIQAAADLYHGGRLQYLIVSGDNSHLGYDEPTEMKAALVCQGRARQPHLLRLRGLSHARQHRACRPHLRPGAVHHHFPGLPQHARPLHCAAQGPRGLRRLQRARRGHDRHDSHASARAGRPRHGHPRCRVSQDRAEVPRRKGGRSATSIRRWMQSRCLGGNSSP